MSSTTASSASPPRFERIEIGDCRQLASKLVVIGAVVLVVALAFGGWAGDNLARLSHSFLLSLSFFLSISLGALFFVVLQHLTASRWSVVTRRVAESLTAALPSLAILALLIVVPLLFGHGVPYEWNDATVRQSDPLVQGKSAFLNAPFFALRCFFYFAIWAFVARTYFKHSVRQDMAGDPAATRKMRRLSGPAMLAYALTVNFAAFDLLMSLDPHWFSTIFGLYYFAGCAVAFFAVLPIACIALQRAGFLRNEITVEHYHDMGKLLFGFNMFWAYIAFSQYLLIWYANIPEETLWFLKRQEGGWQWIGLLLVIGHFAIPFLGLMPRSAKRDHRSLFFWSVVLLIMHWFDLFWLIMPNVSYELFAVGLTELLCLLGVGAIWLAAVLRSMSGIRLIPTGDPYLRSSLEFHNV